MDLDRIKSNRPAYKILYKRKERPIGRELKTPFIKITVNKKHIGIGIEMK